MTALHGFADARAVGLEATVRDELGLGLVAAAVAGVLSWSARPGPGSG